MSFGTKVAGDKATAAWANLIEDALGNGEPVQTADYILYKSGSTYKVRNGTDGTIDYSGTTFATVFNAVSSVCSSGGRISIKPGLYLVTAQLNVAAPLVIEGGGQDSGAQTTHLRAEGSLSKMFYITATTSKKVVVVRDMLINCNVGQSDIGVHSYGSSPTEPYLIMDRVHVAGFNSYGILLQGTVHSVLSFATTSDSTDTVAGTGIANLDASNANTFISCSSQASNVGAFRIVNSNSVTLIECACEGIGNDQLGVKFDSCGNAAIMGGYWELTGGSSGYQFYSAGGSAISILQPYYGNGRRVGLQSSDRFAEYSTSIEHTIEHHTNDDTLIIGETGTTHTNLGAGAPVTLTLPQNAIAGDYFDFVIMQGGKELHIDPGAAGAIIINGAKQTDNHYISADDEAESVRLMADGNGDWIAIGTVGTWSVE